jgi:hypothetical protein
MMTIPIQDKWSLVLRKRNVSDGQLDSAMPKASD